MSGWSWTGARAGRAARRVALAAAVGVLLSFVFGAAKAPLRSQAAPAGRTRPVDIVVSAAISLADALEAARDEFAALHPHIRIVFNLGSSGTLQQQIRAGAPVDLFIAAAPGPMEDLVARGRAAPDAVRVVAANGIVLVRPEGRSEDGLTGWDGLTSPAVRRIALGNPDHVPAGRYGKAVLESLGLWESLQPRFVFGENVRQVLQYVERGEVDAAIVYASDATAARGVAVVAPAPPGSHPPVTYPMAVVQGAAHPEAAALFADFLLSPEGQAVLARHGLTPAAVEPGH